MEKHSLESYVYVDVISRINNFLDTHSGKGVPSENQLHIDSSAVKFETKQKLAGGNMTLDEADAIRQEDAEQFRENRSVATFAKFMVFDMAYNKIANPPRYDAIRKGDIQEAEKTFTTMRKEAHMEKERAKEKNEPVKANEIKKGAAKGPAL